MIMQPKHPRESRTEQVQILMFDTMNGYSRLFGGKLMEWIDVVAAVVARRHSGCNVTTAAVDSLVFLRPAHVNDTIILEGTITYAGRTSMEVRVRTYCEALSGARERVNEAYVVLVAIDDNERPIPVPPGCGTAAGKWRWMRKRARRRLHRTVRIRRNG